ncbi:MAG: peptide deformylase [Phycisphaerae bacterium]|nr:peptide deformylase [Phycisphaerae bacterium]
MTETPLQIIRYPHPVLATRAAEVDAVDDELRQLAARMIETMYAAEGVGLAAPQVGRSIRLFVADPRDSPEPDPVVFVNPRLELEGDLEIFEEGCLSIPDIRVDVRRPGAARILATDLDGEEFALESDGFAARVWQHEFDHLEGRLITDRMSPRDRLVHRRALKEMRADFETMGGL